MWRLGLNLLIRGRFPLKLEGIKRKGELERMMAVVDKLSIDALTERPSKRRPTTDVTTERVEP